MIDKICQAIAKMEGYDLAGSRAQRNNNPGNIKDPFVKGKRIWSFIPIDEDGFLHFPTKGMGVAFLYYLVARKISAGMTLRKLVGVWAPPSENDTNNYLKVVADKTQIDPDVVLWTLLTL